MKTELSQGRGNFWTPFERETELEATVDEGTCNGEKQRRGMEDEEMWKKMRLSRKQSSEFCHFSLLSVEVNENPNQNNR